MQSFWVSGPPILTHLFMPSPRFPVAVLALLGFAVLATAGTEIDQAIKSGLPAFDPKARAEDPTKTPSIPTTPRPLKRLSDPYARLPAVKIVPSAVPAAPAAVAESKNVFVLPKMTVNGEKEKRPALPHLFVQPPVKKVEEPADPNWETPAARSARLVKKHIGSFEQAINGRAAAGKAAAAEAREHAAKQLNSIADLLELSAQLGLDDPEEQKKLRAEYQNALLDRPR